MGAVASTFRKGVSRMNHGRQDSPLTQDDALSPRRMKAWETGEYVKALGPKIEELGKACAQVRQIVYSLRKVLGQ